ncbi:MAG: 2-dehydropantoate 2-reductase [Armatimonadota bacterium]|nr:2-dehydropantoate 2-reductase [Armatimonadota bacterium]MDR7454633.1 2-dehydropantoate 2-reductase [Armatimonadota bacterium]MDR7457226.1 2-dehydropantoate 2-reductase [Armatimonadota bacterium]MDR7497270.1 2-dehydropantoate 2-reductase [Armatimonadota bacterium]
MRVTVIGAGGVGGYYGGMLAAAGHDVTFVARGEHLDALRRQGGLRLRTVHGEVFAPASATDRPPEVPADLVLFTVKSYDTRAAADSMRPVVGPQTPILSLQNGVDNEEVLAELYGRDRVLGGVVYILTTIVEPGLVEQTGGPRTLILGEWRGGASGRAGRLAQTMQDAGIPAAASEDVAREKWVKFAYICAQAGMTALTRLPIGAIRAHPPAWAMFRQILEEVVAVGRARGVRLDDGVVAQHLALAQRVEPHVTSSLYYDLTHGKRLEIEALHGAVVRYGEAAGVPTPACRAVYAALVPHARLG